PRAPGSVFRTSSRCGPPASCFLSDDTAPPEIYTLSLHDALPISRLRTEQLLGDARPQPDRAGQPLAFHQALHRDRGGDVQRDARDRKSTRLNSSHVKISYAVFCLKKKKV